MGVRPSRLSLRKVDRQHRSAAALEEKDKRPTRHSAPSWLSSINQIVISQPQNHYTTLFKKGENCSKFLNIEWRRLGDSNSVIRPYRGRSSTAMINRLILQPGSVFQNAGPVVLPKTIYEFWCKQMTRSYIKIHVLLVIFIHQS